VRIAVIGGGAAGVSAAWTARRAGADVTILFDRPGATSLYSGALDDGRPQSPDGEASPVHPDVLGFATSFESWSLGARGCRVATYEGLLRTARGIDTALLDFTPLAGRTVAVASALVADWDGESLASSLGASEWAVRTKTRFVAVSVAGILDPSERARSVYDVADVHEAPGRIERLAECMQRADAKAEAWLLGPWLGTSPGTAERLRSIVSVPVGETTSPPGGPAGARFDAARDGLLADVGVRIRREHISSIESRGGRFLVLGATSALTAKDAGFDTVVLAVGGLISGGIVLESDGESSRRNGAGLRLSLRAPVTFALDEKALEHVSSPHGIDFSTLGLGALERLGMAVDGPSVRGVKSLFAAGECVADRPRNVLEAARAGAVAGRAALGK
jgi:glycerol-3-phosphate dehydrogenase subunit B